MTNPWSTEFETGLLDDFDFTVERAFFAPDGRYNNGETTLLQWEGKTDNPDVPETHIWFPVGKGWESRDGGKTIQHESGKEGKYYNKSSLMARLIARCVDDFGIGDVLQQRGTPFEAKPWEGMKFHIKSEIIDFGGGSEIAARSKQMPNRFLGIVGEAASAKKSNVTDARAKLEAKKGATVTDLRTKVITTLKASPDFETGQRAALNIDGVSDDDELLKGLLDESGLWTEANA